MATRKRKKSSVSPSLLEACKAVTLSYTLKLLVACGYNASELPSRRNLTRSLVNERLEYVIPRCTSQEQNRLREWLETHNAADKKLRTERKDARTKQRDAKKQMTAVLETWRKTVWSPAIDVGVHTHLQFLRQIVVTHRAASKTDQKERSLSDHLQKEGSLSDHLQQYLIAHPNVRMWPRSRLMNEHTEYRSSSDLAAIFTKFLRSSHSSSPSFSSTSPSPLPSSYSQFAHTSLVSSLSSSTPLPLSSFLPSSSSSPQYSLSSSSSSRALSFPPSSEFSSSSSSSSFDNFFLPPRSSSPSLMPRSSLSSTPHVAFPSASSPTLASSPSTSSLRHSPIQKLHGSVRFTIPIRVWADTAIHIRPRDSDMRPFDVSFVKSCLGLRWATLELCEWTNGNMLDGINRGNSQAASSGNTNVFPSKYECNNLSGTGCDNTTTVTFCVRPVKAETVNVQVSLSHNSNISDAIAERLGPEQLLRFDLDFAQLLLNYPSLMSDSQLSVRRVPANVASIRQPSYEDMHKQSASPDIHIHILSEQITRRLLLSSVRGNNVSFMGEYSTRLVETCGFTRSKVGHIHAAIDLTLLFVHTLCTSPIKHIYIPDALCQIIVQYMDNPE
jgi:hypothetical protein